MAFKTGFVLGAAAGYVLGARAGKERYEQIMSLFGRVAENDRIRSITDKGRAAADLASQRVRESVGDALHTASDGVRDTVDRITGTD